MNNPKGTQPISENPVFEVILYGFFVFCVSAPVTLTRYVYVRGMAVQNKPVMDFSQPFVAAHGPMSNQAFFWQSIGQKVVFSVKIAYFSILMNIKNRRKSTI